jgi:hypothetical protein
MNWPQYFDIHLKIFLDEKQFLSLCFTSSPYLKGFNLKVVNFFLFERGRIKLALTGHVTIRLCSLFRRRFSDGVRIRVDPSAGTVTLPPPPRQSPSPFDMQNNYAHKSNKGRNCDVPWRFSPPSDCVAVSICRRRRSS